MKKFFFLLFVMVLIVGTLKTDATRVLMDSDGSSTDANSNPSVGKFNHGDSEPDLERHHQFLSNNPPKNLTHRSLITSLMVLINMNY
ncbi:hypothetical protein NMG60_11029200 [Bertholletia excelsa]